MTVRIAATLFLVTFTLLVAGTPVRALTLSEALALAEQRNPALRASRQNVESVRASEITAGLRPNPTFQNDTTSETAGLYQLIEIGGKRRARIDSAQLATQTSQTDFADVRRTLVYNVRQTFTNALLAKANLAFAHENLVNFQTVLGTNRLKLEEGAISRADFLKIELLMLQFQTDVEDSILALRIARAALRALIGGADLPQDFEVEGSLAAFPYEHSLAELQQLALTNRPDLKSARTAREKAAADVQLARANSFPDVTIGGGLIHQGNEIGGPSWFTPFFGKGEVSNKLGTGISFPLPLFSRNQGELARTRSEAHRLEDLEELSRNQVLQDVETAYANLQWSRDRVRLYEETYLARAKESRDVAEFAYNEGASSILELLDAERTYRGTQLGYRRELAGFMTNLAQLEAAIGTSVPPGVPTVSAR